MFWILLFAAVAFIAYAMVTQFNNTDSNESVPKRVWAAVVAAGMALGGLVHGWLGQWLGQ